MKRLLKVILWAILVIILLLILGVVAVVHWFNPNDYKAQIAEQVTKVTGRNFTINGDITWSLWPNLGFNIAGASLGNPVGIQGPNFVSIQSANLSIAVWPLLSSQLEVNSLKVNGLEVNLIQQSATQNNWTFASNKPAKQAKASNAATPASNSSSNLVFHISEVSVTNGSIRFIDNVQHQEYQVKSLNFNAKNIALNQSFPMSLNFLWQSTAPAMSGKIDFSADANLDLQQQVYSFADLKLDSQTLMTQANAKPLNVNVQLSGHGKLDMATQTLHISPTLVLNQLLTVNANVELDKLLTAPEYKGNVQIPAFALPALLKSLNQAVPNLPNPKALDNVSVDAQFQGDLKQINIPQLAATLYQSNLQGSLNVGSFTRPLITTDLNVNQIDLSNYANLYGAGLPVNGIHLQANITSQSWAKPQLTQTLNGTAYVSVQQATIQGVDLNAIISNVIDAINSLFNQSDVSQALASLRSQLSGLSDSKQQPINRNNGKSTQFSAFSSQSTIVNGLMKNSLSLTGQQLHMQGNGTVNFNQNNTIDYALQAGLLQSTQANTANIQIPFKITGTPQDLHYGLDMGKLQEQLQPVLMKQLQSKLQQQLQNAAGSLLQNVLGK